MTVPAQRLIQQGALLAVAVVFLACAMGYGITASGLARKGGFDPWLMLYGASGYGLALHFGHRQMTDQERGLVLLWMVPAMLIAAVQFIGPISQ